MISFLLEKKIILYTYKLFQIALYCYIFSTFSFNTFFPKLICDNLQVI